MGWGSSTEATRSKAPLKEYTALLPNSCPPHAPLRSLKHKLLLHSSGNWVHWLEHSFPSGQLSLLFFTLGLSYKQRII